MPYRDDEAALRARLTAMELQCAALATENETLRSECEELQKRNGKARAVFRVMAEARQLAQRIDEGQQKSKPSAAPALCASVTPEPMASERVAVAKEQADTAIQRALLAAERAAAAEQRAELAAERAAFAEHQALLSGERDAAMQRKKRQADEPPTRTSVYTFVRSAPRTRRQQPSSN